MSDLTTITTEPIVISDKLRFDITEDFLKTCHDKNKRLIVTDVIKVVVHTSSPELFDKVVERISDCIVVYAPNNLINIINMKTKDVLSVRSYDMLSETKSLFRLGEHVGEIISDIVTRVVNATTPP